MHVLLGKKQIVLAALVVALGLAVFVNWYFTGGNTEIFPEGQIKEGTDALVNENNGEAELVNSNADEYFSSVKLTRDATHAGAIEDLQAVLASTSEDGEAAANTAQAIKEINNIIKMETDIESLVSGKIGSNCVAVISENSVEVLVPTVALTDNNVLAVSDVINQVCDGKYENIKISGANG